MRTKNARAIDDDESAWLADVKSVACVFCNAPPPVEAHHVKQGRHLCTVAACTKCHAAKAWKLGKPNEFDAINETNRRVIRKRSGKEQRPAPALRKSRGTDAPKGGTDLLPKIVPRRNV
jgi:hypothetical protein